MFIPNLLSADSGGATTLRTRIVIAEDEPDLRDAVAEYLGANGFEVTAVESAAKLREIVETQSFHLAILDIAMPGEDGLSVGRWLRSRMPVGIIYATAAGTAIDRIVGLELGADDYVSKPFNPRELLARIRAVLRRTADPGAPASVAKQVYRFAGWTVNVSAREVVSPAGTKIATTAAEFDLLYALCEHSNRVLSRDQLLQLTHGPVDGPAERSIDTLISRLRQKIEIDPKSPRLIQTVRSEGYMFATQVARR